MKISISLIETSQVIIHTDVKNSYTKGPMYCVYEGNEVYKYPIANIWRITEEYGNSGRQDKTGSVGSPPVSDKD